jgi:hypothetical protein
MTTPLTTAEIVERLREFAEHLEPASDVYAEEIGTVSVAASALLALEGERDEAQRAHEHTKYWYSVRLERLKDLGKEYGIWPVMAAIIANGTADPAEPPTYAQAFNLMLHRAEAAEAELAKVRTALEPFAFRGMSWSHGDRVTITVKISDIEAAREALSRKGSNMASDLEGVSDERKLRRFAMDIIRAASEGVLDQSLAFRLGKEWGLLSEATDDRTGQALVQFTATLLTATLLGDELDRADDPAKATP